MVNKKSSNSRKIKLQRLEKAESRKPEELFSDLIKIYNSIRDGVEFENFYGTWLRSVIESRVNWDNLDFSKIPLKNRDFDLLTVSTSMEIDFSNPGLEEEWFSKFQKYPLLCDFLLKKGNCIGDIQDQLQMFSIVRTFLKEMKTALTWKQEYDMDYHASVAVPGGFLMLSQNGIPGEITYETPYICDVMRHLAETGGLYRIRLCSVCNNLFWAFRLDTKYCSKTCSNRYWQKEYLSDPANRAKNNEMRKQNYERKKDLEIIKQNGNGTF